jgi:hypothetical protein
MLEKYSMRPKVAKVRALVFHSANTPERLNYTYLTENGASSPKNEDGWKKASGNQDARFRNFAQ